MEYKIATRVLKLSHRCDGTISLISCDYRDIRSRKKYCFKMMAPKDFEIGDLVWAKLKNYPFWPAKIVDPPTVLKKDFCTAKGRQKKKSCTRRKAQHYVFFFGSQNYAWIWDGNIVPHSVEMLSNVSRKKSTSYVKAIDEIIAAGGVSVPNLKLVKKEPVENDELSKNLIDGEFVESTIKVEKTEEPFENGESSKEFLDVWNTEKITKTLSVKDDEILKKSPVMDFVKKSRTRKQKNKHKKTKKFVEDNESSKSFSAVKSRRKTTKIPSVADDKLLKKSTVLPIKKRIKPKEKITRKMTKKPPRKRNLTDKARDRKLSPVRKLPRKSEDNSSSINFPRNNTYNPVGVNQPLDDRSMVGQNYVEPSPIPVLDMSRPNSVVREKNISATAKKIGFIGLGTMGQRIVKNLLESGHDVSIWNRTREKCTQFVEAGAHQFLTPCDVVFHCDIIFCCVPGPEATKSVVFADRGILQGFQKCNHGTKLLVVLSALDLKTSQEIASAVTSEGGNYLDAPISGSISDAEAGTLLIIVAGEREFFNDCLTCFNAISRNAYYLSHDIGSASIMHMCTSMVRSITTVALAEGMALAESMDFSRYKFQECVSFSSIICPLIREKCLAMATNNFTTNHSLKHQQSDLQMILETSNTYTQPLALASSTNEIFKKAKRLKYSDHDVSAVYFGAKR
ncbi:putative oxidoreductase GLYR1 homolog [Trichonephila inaurata madagascariensis]|uniref:Cytokine-like nuclear factor N-PAC n=1 Tax=Trichonephila inaurata madagascariensis TaxID=2747483 RepID=A0A8X6YUL6_9ARAC|nr:putative oxidoreductase GLYR1 homolog [Trichonephila inaurata madagascariensis]